MFIPTLAWLQSCHYHALLAREETIPLTWMPFCIRLLAVSCDGCGPSSRVEAVTLAFASWRFLVTGVDSASRIDAVLLAFASSRFLVIGRDSASRIDAVLLAFASWRFLVTGVDSASRIDAVLLAFTSWRFRLTREASRSFAVRCHFLSH